MLIVREEMVVEGVGDGPSCKGFRFPAEVISHAVWPYYRFPLSFREVEELLLARGITVSHETRQRERAMKGFRTVGRTQRFLSAFSQVSPLFRPRRHRMTATGYRTRCATASESGTRSPALPP
ncbi:hypothetical protein ACFU8W_43950 [Streptomyces sp. NPDC057565]|uniref:hypothetical protein n=1 Tax=Streptomyces sp. NPDC057565 TaxID=3346169 RepID=UPI003677ECA0